MLETIAYICMFLCRLQCHFVVTRIFLQILLLGMAASRVQLRHEDAL